MVRTHHPFGELRTDVGTVLNPGEAGFTDFGYTGQRNMGDVGLMDYNARFYSPLLGRFIQPDSIVPSPGNPQSLNLYTYTSNNPVKFVDPTGHIPEGACGFQGGDCPRPKRQIYQRCSSENPEMCLTNNGISTGRSPGNDKDPNDGGSPGGSPENDNDSKKPLPCTKNPGACIHVVGNGAEKFLLALARMGIRFERRGKYIIIFGTLKNRATTGFVPKTNRLLFENWKGGMHFAGTTNFIKEALTSKLTWATIGLTVLADIYQGVTDPTVDGAQTAASIGVDVVGGGLVAVGTAALTGVAVGLGAAATSAVWVPALIGFGIGVGLTALFEAGREPAIEFLADGIRTLNEAPYDPTVMPLV